jgi:hypothetical protein
LIFQGSIKPEPKLNQSMLKPNESREVRIGTFRPRSGPQKP